MSLRSNVKILRSSTTLIKSQTRFFSAVGAAPTPSPAPAASSSSYKFDPIKAATSIKGWTRPHTPGLLTAKELQQYFEEGYVIKHNVLTSQDLQPCIQSVNEMVDELATGLHKAGKIKDACKSAGFLERLTLIEKQYPSASVIIHKRGVLPLSFAQLWSHPQLLSAAKQIVGPDVAGHPVWNLRSKTPGQSEATVPWHQDTAYLHSECWDVLQCTAWIPFVNATKQNGCMQVVRRGHLPGKTAGHVGCWSNTWYVELTDEVMQKELNADMKRDVVLCEVPFGSVLFLNNLIPHRSLPNKSKGIRWSVDLRWQNPNQPNGFFGAKDSIVMAKANDPSFQPDWTNWMKLDRQRMFLDKDEVVDPFDTTIFGPWMGTWPLTNRNKHTDAFEKAEVGAKFTKA